MRKFFGPRRRDGDERRSGSTPRYSAQQHPLFSTALEHLPHARWAVACNGEFRSEGDGLRGILHHDGAILRFTTWGGTERFAASPVDFRWRQIDDVSFQIVSEHANVRFTRLGPLSSFVADPPAFAAAEDEHLAASLASWMATWAPSGQAPLASPM